MNRIVAEGLTDRARGGLSVLVVSSTHAIAREAFFHFEPFIEDAVRVRRTAGFQCIDFASGGRVLFVSANSRGARGVAADTVFVDADVRGSVLDDVVPCLATSTHAELIRG